MSQILYKYLDADGGLSMLYNKNIMFTNATKLNDPFDCHPGLIDFTKIHSDNPNEIPDRFKHKMWINRFENYRDNTYLCSLSKEYNSLLMWSYYNKHQGICIGIDIEKAMPYLDRMIGLMVGSMKIDVCYRNVIDKPVFEEDAKNYFIYQISTKAKDWEHEQEVRLVSYEPSPEYMALLPNQETKDWKEVHAFCSVPSECFESVYLGVNINEKYEKNAIRIAREINPNIKIFKMTADTETFFLKEKRIF